MNSDSGSRPSNDQDHSSNSISALVVPQLGEGLRRVRIMAFLKQPGDLVAIDEPIYEIETDKANVQVESPHSGTLLEWMANEGDEVAVHAVLGRIAVTTTNANGSLSISKPTRGQEDNDSETPIVPSIRIPPRTRAFGRRHGLDDAKIALIPAQTGTLTEDDVLRFMRLSNDNEPVSVSLFEEFPLSARQQALKRNALRGKDEQPLPATVRRLLSRELVETVLISLREQFPALRPTEFQLLAFCAARATRNNPKFRSTLVDGNIIRRYSHVNLGFAVALPEDELTTAVIADADTLNVPDFLRGMRRQLRRARSGDNQADERTTVILSSLPKCEIVDATPILVSPAAAVLFIGCPMIVGHDTVLTLTLTFDHRFINGMGAAQYLNSIVTEMQQFNI